MCFQPASVHFHCTVFLYCFTVTSEEPEINVKSNEAYGTGMSSCVGQSEEVDYDYSTVAIHEVGRDEATVIIERPIQGIEVFSVD